MKRNLFLTTKTIGKKSYHLLVSFRKQEEVRRAAILLRTLILAGKFLLYSSSIKSSDKIQARAVFCICMYYTISIYPFESFWFRS